MLHIQNSHKTNKDTSGQFKMSGNVITYPQNPDSILQLLPQIPTSTTIQIILIGNKSRLFSLLSTLYSDLKRMLD